jgi:hypothetical protein
VLIRYRLDPWPVDGGMLPVVGETFGRALPRIGQIAGRWFDLAPPNGDLQFLPANHRLFRRFLWRLTGRWPGDLVLTSSPATVIELIDRGWDMQTQFLLVLDAACDVSGANALSALRRLGHWDGYIFAPPVVAAMAPGIDGDYALVATDSERRLAAILAILMREFTAAGFQIELAHDVTAPPAAVTGLPSAG